MPEKHGDKKNKELRSREGLLKRDGGVLSGGQLQLAVLHQDSVKVLHSTRPNHSKLRLKGEGVEYSPLLRQMLLVNHPVEQVRAIQTVDQEDPVSLSKMHLDQLQLLQVPHAKRRLANKLLVNLHHLVQLQGHRHSSHKLVVPAQPPSHMPLSGGRRYHHIGKVSLLTGCTSWNGTRKRFKTRYPMLSL
jgi:hypothetical protein